MKEEVAKLWVEALRSGKYRRGVGALRNGRNEFCCLGVLCDISGIGEWERETYRMRSDISGGYLSSQMQEWAGMISNSGCIPSLYQDLSDINDDGASFSTIADLIEKHWKEL